MWINNIITKLLAVFSSIIMLITGGTVISDPGNGKETFTVNFVNYDLKTSIAKFETTKGNFITPPVNPTKSGAIFIGWSGNYYNVQRDETVKAVFNDEKNIFVLSKAEGKIGDTVSVLLSVDGKVKTCGFDLKLNYDSALKLISLDDDLDLDVISNSIGSSNAILLNFSSASDKTKKREIIEIHFKIQNTKDAVLPISLTVNSIKELSGNKVINSNYVVVDGFVKIK